MHCLIVFRSGLLNCTFAIRNSYCGTGGYGGLPVVGKLFCPITSRQIDSFSLVHGTVSSGAASFL